MGIWYQEAIFPPPHSHEEIPIQLHPGKFIQQHRNTYVSIQACIEHVRYQLPNENTHNGYVLDAIEMSDSTPLETIENIEEDTATTGKRNNYESDVAYLLPKYPVAKSCNKPNKNSQSHISDTSAQD